MGLMCIKTRIDAISTSVILAVLLENKFMTSMRNKCNCPGRSPGEHCEVVIKCKF